MSQKWTIELYIGHAWKTSQDIFKFLCRISLLDVQVSSVAEPTPRERELMEQVAALELKLKSFRPQTPEQEEKTFAWMGAKIRDEFKASIDLLQRQSSSRHEICNLDNLSQDQMNVWILFSVSGRNLATLFISLAAFSWCSSPWHRRGSLWFPLSLDSCVVLLPTVPLPKIRWRREKWLFWRV